MTTFAPTFTPRYRAHYICAGVQHSIQVRGARGRTFLQMDDLHNAVGQVFDALHGDLCEDLAWISAEVALTDSDSFFPASVPVIGTAPGNSLSDYSAMDKITAMTISGRSAGARARLSIYGLLFLGDTPGDIGADGLVKSSELAAFSTIIPIMNSNFRAADGQDAVWRAQGTWKPNDHLLKLVRRGTIS